MQPAEFTEFVLQKGQALYRPMPWRDDVRPYYILVSELMLQQTQVARVAPKFEAFIAAFPDTKALSRAPLSAVLALWSGLGYNRRAKFLHAAAQMVEAEFGGQLPRTIRELQTLPGVGPNTAGAIMTYAYNQPVAFIETNVRTVYLHHFFADTPEVTDKEIHALLEVTLPTHHPREFYWALMDYGSWLKARGVRNNAQSKHYKKQSPLEGSLRQMRGWLLRDLAFGSEAMSVLLERYGDDARFLPALEALEAEGFLRTTALQVNLTN